MNPYATTGAQLRSKHVRTLELLQKTLDENNELRDKVRTLNQVRNDRVYLKLQLIKSKKGNIKLGNGEYMSQKVCELEEQVVKLKEMHSNQMRENQESHQLVKTQSEQLETDLRVKENKMKVLLSENTRLKRKCELAEIKIDELKQSQSKQVVDLQEKNKTLQEKLDTNITTIEQLQLEKETILKEITNSKEAAKIAQDASIQMRYRQIELKEKLTGQEKEFKDALDEKENQFKETLDEKESAIESLQKLAQEKAQQYRYEISSLKKQAHQYEAKLQRAKASNTEKYETLNRKLKDEIAALKMALELEKKTELPTVQHKPLFAAHIELKRENHALRNQIDEMKNAQKRYLGSIKKQSVTFPSFSN